jgi:hypothetical protein
VCGLHPRALVRWNQNPSPHTVLVLQSAQPPSQYPGRITHLECRQIEQFVDHSKACKVQIQTQPIHSLPPTPLQRKRKHYPRTQPHHNIFHLAEPSLASAHSIFLWRSREILIDAVIIMGRARIATPHGWARGWLEQRRRVGNSPLPTPVQYPSVHSITHPLNPSHLYWNSIPRTHTPPSLNRVHRPLSAPSSDRGEYGGGLGQVIFSDILADWKALCTDTRARGVRVRFVWSGLSCRCTIPYNEQAWLGSFASSRETPRVMSRTINDNDQSSFVHWYHIHGIFPDSLSLDTLSLHPHCVLALESLEPPFHPIDASSAPKTSSPPRKSFTVTPSETPAALSRPHAR